MIDNKKVNVYFVPHYVIDVLNMNGIKLDDLASNFVSDHLNEDSFTKETERVTKLLENVSNKDIIDMIAANKYIMKVLSANGYDISEVYNINFNALEDYYWYSSYDLDLTKTFNDICIELDSKDDDSKCYDFIISNNTLYISMKKGFTTIVSENDNELKNEFLKDLVDNTIKYFGHERAFHTPFIKKYLSLNI